MAIFPDGKIAKSFTCEAANCDYLICFVLAVLFRDNFAGKIRNAEDSCVMSFDECLDIVS